MRTTVYYFSGTGNTLAVARAIASGLGAELIPIPSTLESERIEPEADAIGIVFPVYYGEPPMLVEDFVGKLGGIEGKYVFAVCTFGGAADASLRMLRRCVRARGGALAAGFGVRMPQNAFRKAGEDRAKLEAAWQKRREFIIRAIRAGIKGLFYLNVPLEFAMMLAHTPFIRPACRKEFVRLSGLPEDAPYRELKHATDKGFAVSDACSGCGICAKVCPVDNIQITDGKPVWQNRCENCLACYNWCPNNAISGSITHNYRYRHSDVSWKDISVQKGNL